MPANVSFDVVQSERDKTFFERKAKIQEFVKIAGGKTPVTPADIYNQNLLIIEMLQELLSR